MMRQERKRPRRPRVSPRCSTPPGAFVIPIMTHPGINRIAKRVIDCVTDGGAQAAAIIELARTYPSAAATSVMDLTLEAEAVGARTVFSDHEIPTVTGALVSNRASLEALRLPSPTAGRLGLVQRVARETAAAITDRPLLASCIGPFSLAGRLFGMTEIMIACLLEPETIHLLLDKCTALIVAHAGLLKAAGANRGRARAN
jgi:uroporphyrinogen decarboxylase